MKIVTQLLAILTICFFVSATTCQKENPNCRETIFVTNDSEKDVYVKVSSFYPDTSLYSIGVLNSSMSKVLSKEVNGNALYRDRKPQCYQKIIEQNSLNTLMILVFDSEIVENTDLGEIRGNYLVLQRYDLTLEDLEKLNWRVSYPPSEEMKDIKMYPAYGN